MAIDVDRTLAVLRRKLEALGYSDPLEPASLQLVQKLVEDLVHTTDSYTAVKQQCAKQAQEIAAFDTRVRSS